jgi:hypothetical protein
VYLPRVTHELELAQKVSFFSYLRLLQLFAAITYAGTDGWQLVFSGPIIQNRQSESSSRSPRNSQQTFECN